jgi:integrase
MAARLPKGIRPKGDKFYVDVTVDGKRRGVTCNTLTEARQKQRELRGAKTPEASTTSPTGDTWQLQTAVDRTIRDVWAGTKAERTATINSSSAVKYFGAWISLDKITSEGIADYTQHLRDAGLADQTINRKLSALSKVLNHACMNGKLASRPLFNRPKTYTHRVREVTAAEESAAATLLQKWHKLDHLDMFYVLLHTGMRFGECQGLEKRDLNFNTRLIKLWRTKGNRPRSIPMTNVVNTILKRRTSGLQDTDKVFGYSHSWFRTGWDQVRSALNLENDKQFVPHVLRHTFCSRLAAQGRSAPEIQVLAGHASLAVTQKYIHMNGADLSHVIAGLDPSMQEGKELEGVDYPDAFQLTQAH